MIPTIFQFNFMILFGSLLVLAFLVLAIVGLFVPSKEKGVFEEEE